MPNQTSSVEINPELRNGTDATYGAVGAATSAQRLLRLRAAKPQAPIMSRKRNSPNARPAPDFQSSAYDIGRPLTVHSTIGSTTNTNKTGPATIAPWQSISNGKGRSLVFLHHLLTIARASIYFTFSKTRVLTLIFPSLDLGEGGVVSITLSPSLLTSRRSVVPVNTSFHEISM